MRDGRSRGFWWLAAFFAAYVLFLYGPMITIVILSFQGPDGGLTFPLIGVSVHWFGKLWAGGGIVDIKSAFVRSLKLGLVVMTVTVVFSVLAGLAYRRKFPGMNLLFYATPIIYPITVVHGEIGGVQLKTLIELNPIAQFVAWSRDIFWSGTWPPAASFFGLIAVSVLTFVVGLAIFNRKSRDIAQEL